MLLTNYYKSHKIERDNRIGIRKAEDKNGENRKDNKDSNSSKNDNGDEDRGVSSGGGQKAERLGGHGDEGGLGRGGGYLGTGSDDSPEREIWQRLRQDHSADFLAEDDWERLRPNLSEGKAVLRPCKGEADYKAKLLQEEMDFWYQGDPAQLVASLFRAGEMTEEDKEHIRRALDGLDD